MYSECQLTGDKIQVTTGDKIQVTKSLGEPTMKREFI